MYDFYPYFTNDGSVGLFSPSADDIYHSTYGALSESWDKFCLPANIENFIENNSEIKILDICFGIGYNSKTVLNIFIKNFLEKKHEKNININTNIEAIHPDNISREPANKKSENNKKIYNNIQLSNEAIYSDNIISEKFIKKDTNETKSLLIHAVDTDKILMELSPFIKTNTKNNTNSSYNQLLKNNLSSSKLNQIFKIKNNTKKVQNEKLKLKEEVSMILYHKLCEQYNHSSSDFESETKFILNKKQYMPFFNKNLLHFASFLCNSGYKYNLKSDKLAFLHNIYYKYISNSNKNVINILNSTKINIDFINQDARTFIKSSDVVYDFIFLDAFTPAKCPALWSVDFFKKLYDRLDYNGMVLTYSSSAPIRNAFLQAGFLLSKIYDPKINRFVGTIAVKNEDLVKHPLSEFDLSLLKTRAGIVYKDDLLNLDNSSIIKQREEEVIHSTLPSASKCIKEHKNAK